MGWGPEIAAGFVATLTLLAFCGRLGWPFELFSNFRMQFLALSLAIALACLGVGDQASALASAVCLLVNWLAVRNTRFLRPVPAPREGSGLTLVWANVWKKPVALDRTLDWARLHNADIVMLGEFPLNAVTERVPDYPFKADTGYGGESFWQTRVAVLSRYPLRDIETHNPPSPYPRPFIRCVAETPNGSLTLIAVHPAAPATPAMLKDRDHHVQLLRDLATAPFVVAGDFNATPWSPVFRRIPGVRVGDPRWRPTWITRWPFLGLTIDHVLVSSGFTASNYEVAPFLRSDHRAIRVRLHQPNGQMRRSDVGG